MVKTQPFSSFASPTAMPSLNHAAILSCADLGAFAIPAAALGSILEASKSCPGTIPIFASLATMGPSSDVGGLVFNSSAKCLKYEAPSSALSWSRTATFLSMDGSTVPAGGVYGLPYDDNGPAAIWSCSAWTIL